MIQHKRLDDYGEEELIPFWRPSLLEEDWEETEEAKRQSVVEVLVHEDGEARVTRVRVL